jgi:phosphodiesterase/alkaline phosphatase D-like protein
MPLYRRLTYGNLAEFNVLDTRQYRDDQAAGGGRDPPNPEQGIRAARSSGRRRRAGSSRA